MKLQFVSSIDGIDDVEINWKTGLMNQLRDIKLCYMRMGYKVFGNIEMYDHHWTGEITAKSIGEQVKVRIV